MEQQEIEISEILKAFREQVADMAQANAMLKATNAALLKQLSEKI